MAHERILLATERDPRKDPRVAEMVRIAAGLGAWKKIAVDVFLRGPAARALAEFPEELADGEIISQYLPMIVEHGGEILCEKRESDATQPSVPCRPIGLPELDSHLARFKYIINL
jgi:hypothetical protein